MHNCHLSLWTLFPPTGPFNLQNHRKHCVMCTTRSKQFPLDEVQQPLGIIWVTNLWDCYFESRGLNSLGAPVVVILKIMN